MRLKRIGSLNYPPPTSRWSCFCYVYGALYFLPFFSPFLFIYFFLQFLFLTSFTQCCQCSADSKWGSNRRRPCTSGFSWTGVRDRGVLYHLVKVDDCFGLRSRTETWADHSSRVTAKLRLRTKRCCRPILRRGLRVVSGAAEV